MPAPGSPRPIATPQTRAMPRRGARSFHGLTSCPPTPPSQPPLSESSESSLPISRPAACSLRRLSRTASVTLAPIADPTRHRQLTGCDSHSIPPTQSRLPPPFPELRHQCEPRRETSPDRCSGRMREPSQRQCVAARVSARISAPNTSPSPLPHSFTRTQTSQSYLASNSQPAQRPAS